MIGGSFNTGGLVGDHNGNLNSVTTTTDVSGIDDVGGLVGENDGTIQDAAASGAVNGSGDVGGLVGANEGIISRSTASGEVTGGDKVGGLAGSNSGGQINLSVVMGAGSVTVQSFQTNNPFPRAGGVVGGNFRGGVINQSYAKSAVSGGGSEGRIGGLVGENFNTMGSDPCRILNSYAAGPVSDSGEVGGLVGGNFRASRVVDSYFDTEATGQSTSAGNPTRLTTAEM